MELSDVGDFGWVWLLFFAVFVAIAIFINRKCGRQREGWLKNFNVFVLFAALAAQLCTILVLRGLNVSQELLTVETWPKPGSLQDALIPVIELRRATWAVWLYPSLGLAVTAFLVWLQFCVPADQQRGHKFGPWLIGFFSLGTVFLGYVLPQPIARVDSRGIGGAFMPKVAWSEITACRAEEWRNAYGVVSNRCIKVLGRDGQTLTYIDTNSAPTAERRRFAAQLRQTLTGKSLIFPSHD